MPDADLHVAATVPVTALDLLSDALTAGGYTIVAPVERDGVVTLDEVDSLGELPVGVGDEHAPGSYRLQPTPDAERFGFAVGPSSIRRWLDPPREQVWTIRRRGAAPGDTLQTDPPPVPSTKYAFVGVRACDLAGVAVLDAVRLRPPTPDVAYAARRDAALFVAVQCAHPASTCFCTSMGTGPAVSTGADVVLTELVGDGPMGDGPHRFLAEARSPRGAELLERLGPEAAAPQDHRAADEVVERATASITRQLDAQAARTALAANPEHPRWADVADRCLSCANCTLVCPTCFCTSHEDWSSLDGFEAGQTKRWDSCFSLDHSYLHGVGPVRPDLRSRYRQWLTHKLSTWWDQFDTAGCVGCGRCITWCPAGIDIVEEANAIAGSHAGA